MPYIPLQRAQNIAAPARVTPESLTSGRYLGKEFVVAGGVHGLIRSEDYSLANPSGWALYGDGTAFFGLGVTVGGDLVSDNWNGANPADLAVVDPDATAGFYVDSDTGAAQFMQLFVGSADATSDGYFEFHFEAGSTSLRLWNADYTQSGNFYSAGGVTIFSAPKDAATQNVQIEMYSTTKVMQFVAGSFSFLPVSDSNYTVSIDATGHLLLDQEGTAGAPSFSFIDDPNTGLFQIGADELGITTGGTQRVSIDATDIVFTPVMRGPDGDATAPAYAFSGDTNTGIYRITTDSLGFTLGGTLRLTINTTAFTATLPWRGQDGSAGAPAFSFSGDTANGMYRITTDTLGFATNGTERVRINTTALQMGSTTGHPLMNASTGSWGAGSGVTPHISFVGDLDTGLGRAGANILELAAGGISKLRVDNSATSGVYIDRRLGDVGNHETLRADRDTTWGLVEIGYFSSWIINPATGKKAKVDVIPLSESPRWKREWFEQLRPIDFRRVSTKQREFGFALDHFKEVDENLRYLTTKGDQWGFSPDEFALLAVTVDYVQHLERRVAALEATIAATMTP